MSDVDLRGEALRWGSAGIVLAAVLVAIAVVQEFPLLLLGMLLFGVPLVVVSLTLGVTDVGVETAASAARIGRAPGNPTQYDPGEVLPIPNKLEVVLLLSGVGVVGLVVLAVAA